MQSYRKLGNLQNHFSTTVLNFNVTSRTEKNQENMSSFVSFGYCSQILPKPIDFYNAAVRVEMNTQFALLYVLVPVALPSFGLNFLCYRKTTEFGVRVKVRDFFCSHRKPYCNVSVFKFFFESLLLSSISPTKISQARSHHRPIALPKIALIFAIAFEPLSFLPSG